MGRCSSPEQGGADNRRQLSEAVIEDPADAGKALPRCFADRKGWSVGASIL